MPNKLVTSGEGGMVLTDSEALAARLRLLRNLGRTQPAIPPRELGFNLRMTNVQAAIGKAQARAASAIPSGASGRLGLATVERARGCPGIRMQVEKPWARSGLVDERLVLETQSRLHQAAYALPVELRARGVENTRPGLSGHRTASPPSALGPLRRGDLPRHRGTGRDGSVTCRPASASPRGSQEESDRRRHAASRMTD